MIKKNISGIEILRILPMLVLAALLGACSTPAPQEPPAAEPAPPPSEPMPMPMAAPEPEPAPPSGFRPDYPDRYVVKKGDTLWDISAHFLNDPWRWPEVWQINPSIRNPHLIYPGDVIVLYYVDGQPRLGLEGSLPPPPPPTTRNLPVEKWTPKIRYTNIESAIETIPRQHIGPYLTQPVVVPDEILERAPYIVSSYEGHLAAGTGHQIYARGDFEAGQGVYYIVRFGERLRDPVTDDVIGRKLTYVGTANLLRSGDPATLRVTNSVLEVLQGDLLLPVDQEEISLNFLPRAPSREINGHIVAVVNGLESIGQYQVVILNRGERDGLEAGSVLAIYHGGKRERDIFSNEYYITPDEKAGVLMVFKTYEGISYALVMEAYRTLRILDVVRNP
ncbi:MAG TPA: LysM peptidoglycan-binding domain-containing protein [Gammaproteobacteria bacterium]|nr:LysM peptidoglycan-binding domain-containing protein [Gammaproteobacteria bacterium]